MKTNVFCPPLYRLHQRIYLLIKSFLTIVLLIISFTASFAADYYFSSSLGDDNRSPSQAQNSTTPWRSIDKLNSFAYDLKAGDRVLFKSGDTFYGSILITRGGNSGNPIIYTSYGSGDKPVITSMARVSNWVSRGNGIYEAALSVMDRGSIQVFTINDQLKEVGRYPNAGSSNDGYLTISSVNSPFSIQGENLPANFVGGEIVIRKNNWVIDRHPISYNAGATVSFLNTPGTIYFPKQNFGYFVQNHVNALDQSGEWAYSKSDNKLYGNFGGQNPNTLNVQVATRDNLIKVNKFIRNLSFINLSLKGANSNLIHIENSGNIEISNNNFLFAGDNAVSANTSPDMVVTNNSIDYSLSGGLFFQYGTPRSIIEDNLINHTMPFQGMASSSDLKGSAIYIAADANNSQVIRNRIYNTGFNGIHFGGNYTIIKNNLIDNYCLYKQDGGGIYTNSDGLIGMNDVGREIEGNIILRGIGAVAGSNSNYKLAEGIYIDDNAMGIKIHKNTIAEISTKGLYIHNNKNIEILDNLFYKTPLQLQITHDALGTPVRNVRVEGNQFSSVFNNELPYAIASSENDINQIGVSNNNYFLDPYGVELVLRSQSPKDGVLGQKRSLKNWTIEFGFDGNSIRPDFNLEKYVVTSTNTIKQSDFNSDLGIISGVYNAGSELVSGISGGSWKISPSTYAKGSAYIQIGAVSSGDQILIEFDTKSISPDQTIEVLLEKTFNQNQEGTIFNFVTASDVKKVKLLLKSNITSGNESVVLRFPQPIQNLLIDNLKISKVTTQLIDTEDQVFFQYNYSGSSVSYPLSGTFKNAKGEVFTGSVIIPAYGSVLLAKTLDGPAQSNLPPTISLSQPVQNEVFTVGDEILIKANAADPEGKIQRVEFYVDETLVNTLAQSPYQFSLNNAPQGTYELKAKVFDEVGQSGESARVAIIVQNVVEARPSQNLPPSIGIIQPTQNQVFNNDQTIVIKTNATDPENKISKVELYYNSTLLSVLTQAPFEFKLPNPSIGNFVLNAKVYDDQGQMAESSNVNISVVSSASINLAPSVEIISPSQNQIFNKGQNVLIETIALDPEGKIAKVEFFAGGSLLGSATSAPYQLEVKNVPTGTFVLRARVSDDQGLIGESSNIFVSVVSTPLPNQAPSISIVTPSQNQTFIQGQSITVRASASDPENKIAKVEFFANESLIGVKSTFPYELTVNNPPLGTYIVKTKVFDQEGLTAESSRINVTIMNTWGARTTGTEIELVSPIENQQFKSSDIIPLQVGSGLYEANYDSLEVYVGEVKQGTTQSLLYDLEAAPLSEGNNMIKVKSFQSGIEIASDSVQVGVVSANKAPKTNSYNAFGEQEYTFEIGPNPTSDVLNIYLQKMYQGEDVEIHIYSIDGATVKVIETNTDTEKITVDVSGYSDGIYFIRIMGKVFVYETKRFIKN
ncbi:Ig-like domain-containing protein [Algoriphagus antarcticus]|uniref:Putative secreted protein (Por secretion system target) n=1 Tax=Algoriphagus antarcticus TaxID=238540 RepID=A0A3E0DJ00_9BACT|nr:Ig-like domain-containing protein [Algoriphagus antarcticus]REG81420.1 putative secreted protein (Por secretion system target) [Algoriphagus antarcticus]